MEGVCGRGRVRGASVIALVLLTACAGRPAPTSPPSQPPPAATAGTPMPTPSGASAALVCAEATSTLTALGGGIPVLQSVTASAHPGYDAVVFTFTTISPLIAPGTAAGSPPPAPATLVVSPARPPFMHDGSGAPVSVTGSAFVRVRFHDAYGYDPVNTPAVAGYGGPTDLGAGLTAVAEVEETGDFEGYLTWVVGLRVPRCWRTEQSAGHLELDFPPRGRSEDSTRPQRP